MPLHIITVIDPDPNVGDDHLVAEFVATDSRAAEREFCDWCEDQDCNPAHAGFADAVYETQLTGGFIVIGPRAVDAI